MLVLQAKSHLKPAIYCDLAMTTINNMKQTFKYDDKDINGIKDPFIECKK